MANNAKQTQAVKKTIPNSMKIYLIQDPVTATATERLVARAGDDPKTSTTAREALCLKGAYIDQLVKQVQGDDESEDGESSLSPRPNH